MKVQHYRDRKVLDLRDSEAQWMVDHGFAAVVEDEAPSKPKRASTRKPKAATQSEIVEVTEGDGTASRSASSHSE